MNKKGVYALSQFLTKGLNVITFFVLLEYCSSTLMSDYVLLLTLSQLLYSSTEVGATNLLTHYVSGQNKTKINIYPLLSVVFNYKIFQGVVFLLLLSYLHVVNKFVFCPVLVLMYVNSKLYYVLRSFGSSSDSALLGIAEAVQPVVRTCLVFIMFLNQPYIYWLLATALVFLIYVGLLIPRVVFKKSDHELPRYTNSQSSVFYSNTYYVLQGYFPVLMAAYMGLTMVVAEVALYQRFVFGLGIVGSLSSIDLLPKLTKAHDNAVFKKEAMGLFKLNIVVFFVTLFAFLLYQGVSVGKYDLNTTTLLVYCLGQLCLNVGGLYYALSLAKLELRYQNCFVPVVATVQGAFVFCINDWTLQSFTLFLFLSPCVYLVFQVWYYFVMHVSRNKRYKQA